MPGKLSQVIAGSLGVGLSLLGVVFQAWPDTQAHMIVCDVGQGDAILLMESFNQVLIDGGRDEQVMACLEKYVPFWDRQLELVVATHPDADHINGLTTVLQNYRVHRLLIGSWKQTTDFGAFWSQVEKQALAGLEIIPASLGAKVALGRLSTLTVLTNAQDHLPEVNPNLSTSETTLSAMLEGDDSEVRNYNDESIALFAIIGPAKVLLTGDLETRGEQALIDQGLLTQVDVLKVGHHGSKTSSTRVFIAKTQPEFSLISAGKNNAYGHPHPEVVDRLLQSGSHLKKTAEEGHIELVANQDSFWFQ